MISKELNIEMHSETSTQRRIKELLKGKENFMSVSRELAKKAQVRESVTVQPKERLSDYKELSWWVLLFYLRRNINRRGYPLHD